MAIQEKQDKPRQHKQYKTRKGQTMQDDVRQDKTT